MTSYQKIYERFLSKCTDFDMSVMSDEDLSDYLLNLLLSSIPKVRHYKKILTDRDDKAGVFNKTLDDTVVEILALLMVASWLEPQVNSVLLTHQIFTESEIKYYSQANHLDAIVALRDNCILEAKKLMRDDTYEESDYFK